MKNLIIGIGLLTASASFASVNCDQMIKRSKVVTTGERVDFFSCPNEAMLLEMRKLTFTDLGQGIDSVQTNHYSNRSNSYTAFTSGMSKLDNFPFAAKRALRRAGLHAQNIVSKSLDDVCQIENPDTIANIESELLGNFKYQTHAGYANQQTDRVYGDTASRNYIVEFTCIEK